MKNQINPKAECEMNYKESSIFGMTCDGYDVIANTLNTPEMEVGDWIVIGGMGSYTVGP